MQSITPKELSAPNASDQQQLVPVPANLLNTLLTSIKALETKVSNLQSTCAALENKLAAQHHPEAKFWRFPKLPPEVRALV